MNKQKIIITGRNYTSILGMVRAFRNTDYEIIVICIVQNKNKGIKSLLKTILCGKPIEACSKYIDKYIKIEKDESKIINLLIANYSNEKNKTIIIPTDDFTLSVLDTNYNKLSKYFEFPNVNNEQGALTNLLKKSNQKSLAKKSGLNVTKEYYVTRDKQGNYIIPPNIEFPIFLKPESSFEGMKLYMKKCSNKEELISQLKYIENNGNCSILIEKFIFIEQEYGVLGCSYNDNVYIPGIIKKLKVGKESQQGVTLLGQTLKISKNNETFVKLNRFIKSLNFNGLFDIEIYECDNKYYFGEINLRYGVYGQAFTYLGVNLPQLFIDYILNNNIEEPIEIKEKTFVNERACFENYKSGLLSIKEYKSLFNKSDFCFTKLIGDERPFYQFKRNEYIFRLLKIIKRKIK